MRALTLKLGIIAGLMMVAFTTERGYRLGALALAVAILVSRSEPRASPLN